ncbi:MAG: hypothetical protein R2761_27715 [Acidimicrobiales bacterium]
MIGRWLAPTAPARRLAVFRVLVGAFALVYLTVRLPAFWATASLTEGFDPVGVLAPLDRPLPTGLVRALVIAAPLLAAAVTAGLWFRVTGPAFAAVLLVVLTYRSSWGRLLYFDNLLVLHALVLACSPAADSLAVRIRRPSPPPGPASAPTSGRHLGPDGRHLGPDGHHPAPEGRHLGPDPAPPTEDPRYGWPLRLCALVTVTTYVLAGVAKLRIGGSAWLDGDTLANHIAFSAARLDVLGGTPSPAAHLVLRGGRWLLAPAAVATIVLEVGAPLALWSRLRTPWVIGLWGFHAAVAATMFVLFPYPLALVAFAPLYRLERWRWPGPAPAWLTRRGTWGPVGPASPA